MRKPSRIPQPLTVAELMRQDRRNRLQDEAGSMCILAGVIVAGMAIVLLLVFGWAHHHYTQPRIDRLQADLKALQTFTSCTVPPKPGDTLVITVRRHADQIATRCQLITNPREPERAFQ